MKKILITGSNGLLGQTLVNKLSSNNDHDIVAVSRGSNDNFNKKGYKYISLDISEDHSLERILSEERPDFIINSGAITDVDLCEKKATRCHEVNTKPLEILTKYCKNNDCFLIHISTDFVFDGKKEGDYFEDDITDPVNEYGKSKNLAEKIIIDSNIDYAILRTSLVYGFVEGVRRSNIVLWIKENLEKGKNINIIYDQFRMPTYVGDLAIACISCIKKMHVGIFHICGGEYLPMIDLAYKIADFFSLNKNLIIPISTKELNQQAKRPLKTKMNLEKSKQKLDYIPKKIFEGLELLNQDINLWKDK